MTAYYNLPMNLHLHDGAAAGGASAGGEGAAAQGETTAAVPGTTRRGKTGEFDNVVFGVQDGQPAAEAAGAPDAGEKATTIETSSDAKDARAAEWRKMIEGDYKEEFAAEMQRIINQRFKETKNLQSQLDGLQPLVTALSARYGESDPAKLAELIDNDSAYWSEAADEAGMSVEQYKELQKLKAQNQQLMEEQKRRTGEDKANRQIQAWYSEAEAVKARYPEFDLNAEVQNPNFLSLLKSGTPMELAYRVIHMDALMTDAVQSTAAATEAKVTANIRAKGARPAESGAAAQGGIVYRNDVSKLTKAERAEIARRVGKGETIRF